MDMQWRAPTHRLPNNVQININHALLLVSIRLILALVLALSVSCAKVRL